MAAGLGLPAPTGPLQATWSLSRLPRRSHPDRARSPDASSAWSPPSGADLTGIGKLRTALTPQGAVLRVIAPIGGTLGKGARTEVVERTFTTTRSMEFDAVLIAGGVGNLADIKLSVLLQEAFRHATVIGAWGDGAQALATAASTPPPQVSFSATPSSRPSLNP